MSFPRHQSIPKRQPGTIPEKASDLPDNPSCARLTFLALDPESAGQGLAGASNEHLPEQIFERSWALAFLQQVLGRLRDEASQAGRGDHFEELKIFLTGGKSPVSYAALAARLGSSEMALRQEVHRLGLMMTDSG